MEHYQKELLAQIRPETRPVLPGKVRFRARIFGKQKALEYIGNYYERESAGRIPFYLPYIYRRELFDHMRRLAKIPKSRVGLVLIDGEDARTDFLLYEFLDNVNYLTIITERMAYFTDLQERAFQELGLLVDLVKPWEEKQLEGNLVWDLTENIQKADCYPPGSIALMAHKKLWKVREQVKMCENITAVYIRAVNAGKIEVSPAMAECFLVPGNFPFRESRCLELERWCRQKKWAVHAGVETAKNLDI